MRIILKLSTVFLVFASSRCMAQRSPAYTVNRVRINDTDKTVLAEILPVDPLPTPKPQLNYYWYSANEIHILQGGFSGQLLNGSYTEYYKNKNVRTQGTYKKGLKNGEWKLWNMSGKLMEITNWNAGIKRGDFFEYDQDGRLSKSGSYKEDELDGPVRFYLGKDSIKTIRYKSGHIVQGKHKNIFDRIKIFGKKNKRDSTGRNQPENNLRQ